MRLAVFLKFRHGRGTLAQAFYEVGIERGRSTIWTLSPGSRNVHDVYLVVDENRFKRGLLFCPYLLHT